MTITKKLYDLTAGTVIYRNSGDIVLTSGYDSHRGAYSYADLVYDEETDEVQEIDGGYVTPADLLGDKYDG